MDTGQVEPPSWERAGQEALDQALDRLPADAPLRQMSIELRPVAAESLLTPTDGEPRPAVARSIPVDATGQDLPAGTVPAEDGGYRIELSDQATDLAAQQAIVHEIAELLAVLERAESGLDPWAPDVLRPGGFAEGSQLSPHDLGRLAEIEWLTELLHDPATVEYARAEVAALRDHLGLRPDEPGAGQRRRLIDAHLSDPAQAALAAADRPGSLRTVPGDGSAPATARAGPPDGPAPLESADGGVPSVTPPADVQEGADPREPSQQLSRVPFDFAQFFRDKGWTAAATRFEQALGAYYFNDPQTINAARTALERLRDALMELTPRREGESEADFVRRVESAFFRDPDHAGTRTSAGQALPDTTVDQLLDTGNLRELVTAFYNAAYYNRTNEGTLSHTLLDVYDRGRWDVARAAELNLDEIQAMRRQLDENPWRPLADRVDSRLDPTAFRFARDPFGTGNVVMRSKTPFRDLTAVTASQLPRVSRPEDLQAALANTAAHYQDLGTPLGEFERRYVENAIHRSLDPDTPLPWREGAVAHSQRESGPLAQWMKRMTERGFVVVDGISATTTRMLTAAKFLGLSRAETELFVGALMGWMLPGRDHSLLEIVRGAQIAGFGHLAIEGRFTPVDFYRNLPGMDLHTLRTQVLPDGLFPHEARYLARAQDPNGFSETQHPRVRAIADRLWPQLRDGRVTDQDLTDWLHRNKIDPADADAVQALAERLSESHIMAITVYTRHSHYLINNVVRTHLWTAGVSEALVRSRMADKVEKLVSNYLENLATGGRPLPLPLALRPLLHVGEGHLDSRSPLGPAAQRWVDASQRAADAEQRVAEHKAAGRIVEATRAEAENDLATSELQTAWNEINRRLDPVTHQLFDEMRWHADMVHDALMQLPAVGSPDAPTFAYRGDWRTPVHSPIYGSRLWPPGMAREFLSMSPRLEVAIRFMVENPASDRRIIAVYRLTGAQAREISVFSSFAEDQEAVLPPRSATRQVRDPELVERVRVEVAAIAEDMVRRRVIPVAPERYEIIVIEEDPSG